MLIGIPKEISPGENRVAAIPETVMKFIALGFEVAVESSVGEGVYISDGEYELAGACLYQGPERLYAESDIVLKIKPPVFNKRFEKHEAEMLRNGSVLISSFQEESTNDFSVLEMCRSKNITVFDMDAIPRNSKNLKMSVSYSMGVITGYKAVLMAINQMSGFAKKIETPVGSIPAARFLIIGAGVVGRQAIITAKDIGGVVTAVDIRKKACDEARRLGAKVLELPCFKVSKLYGVDDLELCDHRFLPIEHRIITPHIEDADVVILSAYLPQQTPPILVTEQIVSTMKSGSVIVDVPINHGGNCEITEPGKIIQRTGVYIFGIKNIPQKMASHSSLLYANNVYYFVKHLFKKGMGRIDFSDEVVQSALADHFS